MWQWRTLFFCPSRYISRILTAGWSYQTVDICIIDSSFPYVFLIASLVYSWCSWGSGAGTLHSFFKYSRYMTSHSFFSPGFVRLWWLNTIHVYTTYHRSPQRSPQRSPPFLRGLKTWKRDAGCSRPEGSGMIRGSLDHWRTMGILAFASGFLTWRTGKSQLPSGKHTKSYWKWPCIMDFPIKHGDFLVMTNIANRKIHEINGGF